MRDKHIIQIVKRLKNIKPIPIKYYARSKKEKKYERYSKTTEK